MSEKSNKKALIVASVGRFLNAFERNDIGILQSIGVLIDCAVNQYTDENNIEDIIKIENVNVIDVPFPRTPFSSKSIISYKKIRETIIKGKYSLIHCHTPVASFITRMAIGKNNNSKVIYTAHGFHFYKGAPIKNWIIFFPAEWLSSFRTDVLITITIDDYIFAKKHMHAKKVYYVPGVGIDTGKFYVNRETQIERKILKKYDINDSDFVIISVGELNVNKNHQIVIKAMAKMNDPRVHYCIAGHGDLFDELQQIVNDLNLTEKVHLLGQRSDVKNLLKEADIYALPSIREGLNVSLMEAMASGLPCICGDIRGNNDLIVNNKGGYRINVMNMTEWIKAIKRLRIEDNRAMMGAFNARLVKEYDLKKVGMYMETIYNNEMQRCKK